MKPAIRKLGTIDCDLVETTPIVFRDRVHRFEYVRTGYAGNKTGDSYFRFVDHASGEVSAPFARGYHLGNVFVERDLLYVTGTNIWDGERVDLFVSADMESWETRNALNLPGYGIFNTSMCRAEDRYVLMFEVGRPPEVAGVPFTARFAVSTDLQSWELTPPECTYAKERYTAPHCLRYLDGHYYDFYLEANPGPWYDQRVVRSRDLVTWEPSPLNPVLEASDEDRIIATSRL
ncbi:MAG: glycoside hydrolase family 43 protein, partial [Armatimonadetes bacterium]|nr:glycoside hydrolase family 43 protein [Armatimonadota bacterium]